MSKPDDGGSAFPESYSGADAPHDGIGNGMTVRQVYAGLAMASTLGEYSTATIQKIVDAMVSGQPVGPDAMGIPKSVAVFAHSMADAMIAEGKEPGKVDSTKDEMLSVLYEAQGFVESATKGRGQNPNWCSTYIRIKAAIAQAKGKL